MKICPACHQVIPEMGKRACSLCHQAIKRSDKWQFGADSRAQHRVCPAAPIVATQEPEPVITSRMLQFSQEEGQ